MAGSANIFQALCQLFLSDGLYFVVDIQNGQLFFHMNKRLCYIRSVNWKDILLDRSVTYDKDATDDNCTSKFVHSFIEKCLLT